MRKFASKKSLAGFAVSLLAAAGLAARANESALIPWPQQCELQAGAFQLAPDTEIAANAASIPTAKLLAARLRQATTFPLAIHRRLFSGAPAKNCILLTTQSADPKLGPEGYELSITTNSVVIRAPQPAGLFYGTQTLLQLLPPEIFSSNQVANAGWTLPCVQIKDWPRFKWRGFMLDVSRHFYNPSEVERILDLMALYKMNTFHWHLSDDEGWRLEIKKYPELTQTGAWREHVLIHPPNTKATNAHPAWVAPTPDKFRQDGRYGGYYTQEQVRAIVAYASARHITIVPEIEMPAHSRTVLAIYPQLGCFGGLEDTNSDGLRRGAYDPSKEETFRFLENVLTEVCQLFPGPYVHIGGDELNRKYWTNSPDCVALMQREGLKNARELQSWFTQRIGKFVVARGKTLVGWSEITQGGLAQKAVLMDWIGGGKEAAGAGHDVVMTPVRFCYLNSYQSTNLATEPPGRPGRYFPMQRVYSFEPIPANLPAQYQSHILGAQADLWTDYAASLPHAENLLFPRFCALAEVFWSPKSSRDWEGFQQRLQVDEHRLEQLGVNYYRAPSAPTAVLHSSSQAALYEH